jgi:hypothetical protein
MAGVATAFAIAPSAAFAKDPITFENHVETTVVNDYGQIDLTGMTGEVTINGSITADSASTAITDAKQIMSYDSVVFQNPGFTPCDDDGDDCSLDFLQIFQNAATVGNNATSGTITGSGNVGQNVAAGQNNMQQNSANMAVSANANPNASGGWASASTTGYQSLSGTSYEPQEIYFLGYDVGHVPFADTNNATSGAVNANGNIGVNVAAGAFNQQQNLMTLAVANNSVLSQSTAALWQTASCNTVDVQTQSNTAIGGDIAGTGNIGVNVAAGVGNQQENSLTAAVSNATGGGS